MLCYSPVNYVEKAQTGSAVCKSLLKVLQDDRLAREDFACRGLEIEPAGAIDFGKRFQFAGLRRPLHLEQIAFE
jgi:hypothetical protein